MAYIYLRKYMEDSHYNAVAHTVYSLRDFFTLRNKIIIMNQNKNFIKNFY